MKKNEIKRREIVREAIKNFDIPKITLWNRYKDEKKLLSEMIEDKLYLDLLEQDTSNTGKKCFDWIIEDFRNAKEIEDFTWLLPQSYGNNGEFYYNNDYDFFNEETEEDDLSDYTQKAKK